MRLNAPQMYGYVCGGGGVCVPVCVSMFYAFPVCLALPPLWTKAGSQPRNSSDSNKKHLKIEKHAARLKDEGCQRLWQIPGDSLQYF